MAEAEVAGATREVEREAGARREAVTENLVFVEVVADLAVGVADQAGKVHLHATCTLQAPCEERETSANGQRVY